MYKEVNHMVIYLLCSAICAASDCCLFVLIRAKLDDCSSVCLECATSFEIDTNVLPRILFWNSQAVLCAVTGDVLIQLF